MIEGSGRGRPAFLASVTSAEEADIACEAGADVIDCKDPSAGALGALDALTVREIVARIAGRLPVSATIGDLPAEAGALVAATAAMAATGVDIVKIGFFGDRDPRPAIAALGEAAFGPELAPTRLVAVLMADREPDLSLIPALAAAGFVGVMLDTAAKSAGSLTTILPADRLALFVDTAAANGLFAGLAGSLRKNDIAELARLGPDMLGFRGALCAAGRTSALDAERVATIRDEIDRARTAEEARETSVV
jgi:uncharacterized protein (UPF0264 family)